MQKKIIQFNVTHVFADGTVVADSDFCKSPPIIDIAKCADLADDLLFKLSPDYRIKKRAIRRWELAKQKKAEFEKLQAELDKQKEELF